MAQNLTATLASLASECLNVPECDLGPQVPLSRYGLDSLATVELTAALERLVGHRLPDSLLLDHPDLRSLECYFSTIPVVESSPFSCADQMQRDSLLPRDIQPATRTGRNREEKSVLLTGATGFLGSHLLRSILRYSRCRVYCLARSREGRSALSRIKRTMQNYRIWDADFESRIEVVEGDLTCPRLGLDEQQYTTLCHNVCTVYHSAAAVNWVCSYQALRNVNVLGTQELIRFACADRPKAFHFVSTVSVCYSTSGPREIYEDDELFSYRHGIHLGYAQSKSVGEVLVRQAGDRGLPVSIFRASLLAGDRNSAIPNADDLLSRLIKATVQMGKAPDLDWRLDCCPVDHVAHAIVQLANHRSPISTFHLVNPRPRHWREFVLWMNLFGYRVQLRPYRQWLERLEREAIGGHPLRELLPFFLRKPSGEGGLTLPELYEEPLRSQVRSESTRRILKAWPLPEPELDARLLHRYFLDYIDRGLLPPVQHLHGNGNGNGHVGPVFDAAFFTGIMRRFCEDNIVVVSQASKLSGGSEHSIISELASWRYGSAAGLSRYRLTVVRGDDHPEILGVCVKTKAKDSHVIDVAERIASQCSSALGQAFHRVGRHVGLVDSHRRELGIYQQCDERFRRHAPTLFGTSHDDRRGEWVLVMEDISALELLDTVDDVSQWENAHIETVLRDLALLHSIWYQRESQLMDQPWLGPVTAATRRAAMSDLWTALAEFAAERFGFETGSDMKVLQRRLVADVGPRSTCLERMPRTLIHNDFNPRNIALRPVDGTRRLCAYDWELATIGVPQHDLAEFLCFVLTAKLQRAEVRHYLDLYRSALEQATRCKIDAAVWELGFRLSLHDLLIDRFAMYAMVDRFRPQRFLGRVINTWHALYDLYPVEETH